MNAITAWLDQYHIGLTPLLTSLAVFVVGLIVISLLKRLLEKWLKGVETHFQLSAVTITTIIRLVTAVLWLIVLLIILDAWGVGLAGVWGLLVSGTAVIGVGFLATWAIVSNCTSSLFLTVWRPFQVGDTVVLLPENTRGRVIKQNLMFTALQEDNSTVIYVPNNFFFQKLFTVTKPASTDKSA